MRGRVTALEESQPSHPVQQQRGDCRPQGEGQALEKEGLVEAGAIGGLICGHFLQHPKSGGCEGSLRCAVFSGGYQSHQQLGYPKLERGAFLPQCGLNPVDSQKLPEEAAQGRWPAKMLHVSLGWPPPPSSSSPSLMFIECLLGAGQGSSCLCPS